MEWISLKAAYLVVLWLTEEKLKVPKRDRLGEWHIGDAQAKPLNWSRTKVALHLPSNHFDNSLYGSETDESLILGNVVDGDLNLKGDTSFYKRKKGDPLDRFADAHLQLLELLQNGTIEARSKYTLGIVPEDISEFNSSTVPYEAIDKAIWREKPLPSYQLSALHLGQFQSKYIFAKFNDSEREPIKTLLHEGFEYWLTNIEIRKKEFENWLLPQLPIRCLLPEHAILKPHNGKFLIQFGDEYGEFSANKGLHCIYFIMKHGKSFDANAKGINIDYLKHLYDGAEFAVINQGINEESNNDFSISDNASVLAIDRLDTDTIQRLINYRIKHLRYYIEKYWEIMEVILEQDIEDLDERIVSELKARKDKTLNWAKKTDSLAKQYLSQERIYYSLVKSYIDCDEPPETMALREHFKAEATEEEKSMASFRKAIQREIARLSDQFPKFARHLGRGTTDSTSGILVKKSSFSYFPVGKIDWKFD